MSGIALAVSACLTSNAWSADAVADSSDVAQLRKQLGDLTSRYEAQSTALQALAQRLQQLENSSQGQARPIRAVNKTIVAADADAPKATGDESKPTYSAEEAVIKEAPASRSAEAVYREQNALFNKTFTLETGLTYSHSDRRQLALEGFLALDAIFLGKINLDHIKSDIVQFDVSNVNGVSQSIQVAGQSNRINNGIDMQVELSSAGQSGGSIANAVQGQAGTMSANASDGTAATVTLSNNNIGVNITVPGQGEVLQQIRNQGMLQSARIGGDLNQIHNAITMHIGLNAATGIGSTGTFSALQSLKTMPQNGLF